MLCGSMRISSCLFLPLLSVFLGSLSAFAEQSPETIFWHDQIQWGASQAEAQRIVATNQDLKFLCFRLNPAALPEATGCTVKQRGAATDTLNNEAFFIFYQNRFFRYELFFSNDRFSSISSSAERQLGRPARSTAFAVEGTRGKYTTQVKLWEPRHMKVFMLSHMRSDITKGKMAVTYLPITNGIPNLDPREPIEKEFPHLFAPGLDSFRSPPF